MEIVDLLEYSERGQLREWFELNAASAKCCWIAMYRGKKKPEGVHVIYEVTQKDMDAFVEGMKKRMEGME